MILYTKITLQQLSKEGKNHKWGTYPCTKCDRNMWGHGYVARYFTEVSNAVYLKKYRCPNCRVVVIVKPEGFWPHIRSAISTVYKMLRSRISKGTWPAEFPRQRGGHWLKRFAINAKMSCEINLLTFLDRCFVKELHFFP
jgi:hypothetical protein